MGHLMIPAPTQDAGTSPAGWHETCLGNRDCEAVNLGANDAADLDGFLKMGDRAKTLVSRIIRIFNRVCLPTLGFTQGWVPTNRRNGQHFRNFQVCTSMFLETLEWVECFFFLTEKSCEKRRAKFQGIVGCTPYQPTLMGNPNISPTWWIFMGYNPPIVPWIFNTDGSICASVLSFWIWVGWKTDSGWNSRCLMIPNGENFHHAFRRFSGCLFCSTHSTLWDRWGRHTPQLPVSFLIKIKSGISAIPSFHRSFSSPKTHPWLRFKVNPSCIVTLPLFIASFD